MSMVTLDRCFRRGTELSVFVALSAVAHGDREQVAQLGLERAERAAGEAALDREGYRAWVHRLAVLVGLGGGVAAGSRGGSPDRADLLALADMLAVADEDAAHMAVSG